MNEKSDNPPASSHSLLLFVAGAVTGAAALILLLPETRERTRDLVKKTVEVIRDGELTTDVMKSENHAKKAMKAGWEAFLNTLAEDSGGKPSPPTEE